MYLYQRYSGIAVMLYRLSSCSMINNETTINNYRPDDVEYNLSKQAIKDPDVTNVQHLFTIVLQKLFLQVHRSYNLKIQLHAPAHLLLCHAP